MATYRVVNPHEKVWFALAGILTLSFDRIGAKSEESRTLAQTRDLLLPKLMSGEIRLGDAERIVEDAA